MKMRYKVEVRCLLNRKGLDFISKEDFICVIRKIYFRRKLDAVQYKNNILDIYHSGIYGYMSFNDYILDEEVDKVDGTNKFVINLYMDSPD